MKLGRGIYLRGDIYWLAYQVNGKRTFVTLQTSDAATALTRAAEVRGTLRDESPDKSVLRAEVDRFIVARSSSGDWSRDTTRVHGEALREFAAWAGDNVRPTQVTPVIARNYYAWLQSRLSESGTQIRMRAVKTFFATLVKQRRLAASPFAELKMRRIPKMARTNFCTREQRDKLIAEAPSDDRRFIFYCGFHAGMRRKEITEARVNWFDLRPSGNVHVQNTATFTVKDQDNRFVPPTKDFQAFLVTFLAGGERDSFALAPTVKQGKSRYR
jgi:site-specific recombinase XerD